MKQLMIILIVLLVSGVSHAWNMFNFPYYENDEGVYLSQAWSLVEHGRLAPYTYWYDHAPAGWIFTALWLSIFKSLFTWGFSLNSGRVFMLVIHLFSTFILIKIAKKLTGSNFAGMISAVFFSLSPLGLYFQRRLLLDNLMIFWVLLSYLLLLGSATIVRTAISGLIMGIAVLTKENAVFFIPGFIFTIWHEARFYYRRLMSIKWLFIVGCVVSVYLLYAILNGEFFPYGTPVVGGDSQHVSLLETLKFQYSRPGGSFFDTVGGSFWQNIRLWLQRDPFIILAGFVSNIFIFTIALIYRRNYLGPALLGLFFWWFLARGGIVIEFYIIPILPLLSLFLGLTIYELLRKLPRFLPPLVFLIVFISYTYFSGQSNFGVSQNRENYRTYTSQQTLSQKQAVAWIRKYIPVSDFIVVDNYSWLELRDPKNPSGLVYPNAHWYWKVDQDSDVLVKELNSDPANIDFIARTPQMVGDLITGASPTTQAALNNAKLVTGFNSDGWEVEIWATHYPRQILSRSWNYYKHHFLQPDGRTIDPSQSGRTTSEGQSYALLKSVWMDDRRTFDRVLNWTIENLQKPDGTFIWLDGGDETASASDADVDTALALILAYRRWHDSTYLDRSKLILAGIWEAEVKQFSGQNYLVPGNWALGKDTVVVNPSYFSPAAFRIFSEVDPGRPWLTLVDSSYRILTDCSQSGLGSGNSVGLPPNWCALDESGNVTQPLESGINSTEYSYDAVRVMWRVALDYFWFAEPRAKDYLKTSGDFLAKKWQTENRILVGYTHSGQDWENYQSSVGYMAAVANFSVSHPDLASQVYDTKLKTEFYEDFTGEYVRSYWEDPDNYYTQNWAWFGTALYHRLLPDRF